MSSVQQLQAQIDKISNDIELQKQLLEQLECSKSRLQRQLNAIRDPIAKLPLEISSEIFLQCLPPLNHAKSGTRHISILLLNICNTWTEIALSTPALWAALHIVFPSSRGFRSVLEAWLRRAHGHPLYLVVSMKGTVRGIRDDVHGVGALIQRHSGQLKYLEIRFADSGNDCDLPFETTETSMLPSLQTLAINGYGILPFAILQLLRRSSNLIELALRDMNLIEFLPGESEAVIFPHLRQFLFVQNPWEPDSDDEVLRCITAPSLESLIVHKMNLHSNQLLFFLQRSSPPLQSLVFECSGMRGRPLKPLGDLLALIPTLTKLDIMFPTPDIVEFLSNLLSKTQESKVVPSLRTLEIQLMCTDSISEFLWSVILTVLVARRVTLRTIRIIYTPILIYVDELDEQLPAVQSISSDTLAALRELFADGMDIWVGTPKQNMLLV